MRKTRPMTEYRVERTPLADLEAQWAAGRFNLAWPNIFVLPGWLHVWWRYFGHGAEPAVWTVYADRRLIGMAPLMREGNQARFMGDPDVCDYQDFIIAPGWESVFFRQLFEHLQDQGIHRLKLGALHADASILRIRPERLPGRMDCRPLDVTYEMPLPSTWQDYLGGLRGKDRHEIRRKLRRLREAGRIGLKRIDNRGDVAGAVDVFLELFRASRSDKLAFMSPAKAGYFRALAEQTAVCDLLNLYLLEIDGYPAAAVISFVYNRTLFLYNNGYDRHYQSLSVGFLSKVLTIRDSIRRGLAHYSFLRGAEPYKYRLGGRPQPVYQCVLALSQKPD